MVKVRWFALAGGVIPLLLLMSTYLELWIDIKRMPITPSYGLFLWPSWLLLLGVSEAITVGGLLSLLFSISVNILLYASLGFLLNSAWECCRGRGSRFWLVGSSLVLV